METREAVKELKVIYLENNAVKIQLAASKDKVKELKTLLEAKDSTILKIAKKGKERIDEIARIKGRL
ncbi:hypothetical protein KAU51_05160, partial [Candidatus Parcubacteria bacterium]|nr:hypothetical protein [Candidatus Parcubacteria bacterium]